MSLKHYIEKVVISMQIPKVLLSNKCSILECYNSSIKACYVRVLRCIKRERIVEFIKLKNLSLKTKYVLLDLVYCNKQILLCEEHNKL